METNFELSLKAEDQCGVKDQGDAVAKLAVTATDCGVRWMMEPKTVEAKGAVDSQAAVQVEAKSKVMCGGFASVKTAIAADMTVIAGD